MSIHKILPPVSGEDDNTRINQPFSPIRDTLASDTHPAQTEGSSALGAPTEQSPSVPHSGSLAEDKGRELPFREFGSTTLSHAAAQGHLKSHDTPAALAPQPEQKWLTPRKLLAGALALGLVGGGGFAAVKVMGGKSGSQPVATSTPNPGETSAAAHSSAETNSTASGEVAVAPGTRGGIDLITVLPGDKTMTLPGTAEGETIRLPYLRDPNKPGVTQADFINSFLGLYAYYMSMPSDSPSAAKVLEAIASSDDPQGALVIKQLKVAKADYQALTNHTNDPTTFVEMVFFGDDSTKPNYSSVTDPKGNPAVQLKGGTVFMGTFSDFKGLNPEHETWQAPFAYNNLATKSQLSDTTDAAGNYAPGVQVGYGPDSTGNIKVRTFQLNWKRG